MTVHNAGLCLPLKQGKGSNICNPLVPPHSQSYDEFVVKLRILHKEMVGAK